MKVRMMLLISCLSLAGCMTLDVRVTCPPGTAEEGVKVSVSAKQEKNVTTNTNPSLTTGDTTIPASLTQ